MFSFIVSPPPAGKVKKLVFSFAVSPLTSEITTNPRLAGDIVKYYSKRLKQLHILLLKVA